MKIWKWLKNKLLIWTLRKAEKECIAKNNLISIMTNCDKVFLDKVLPVKNNSGTNKNIFNIYQYSDIIKLHETKFEIKPNHVGKYELIAYLKTDRNAAQLLKDHRKDIPRAMAEYWGSVQNMDPKPFNDLRRYLQSLPKGWGLSITKRLKIDD